MYKRLLTILFIFFFVGTGVMAEKREGRGGRKDYSWIKIFFTDGTPLYCFKTNNLCVEFKDGGQEVRTYWDSTADNGKGGRGAYVTNLCYKIWDHSDIDLQYYQAKSDYKTIEAETSHISDGHVVVDSSYGTDGNCIIWLKKTNIDHVETYN